MKKNILILGSGGRESAFAWKFSKDKNIDKIFCIPGNAGTDNFGINIDIPLDDHRKILDFVNKNKIYLTMVGPEDPLNLGIVDFFRLKNKMIFGPTKMAAQLESSKLYARDIMKKYNIPHPEYYACKTIEDVMSAKNKLGLPIVLKADGLAAGKGVIICNNEKELENAYEIFFEKKAFGEASNKISVEKCISGPEISIFTVCNGSDYIVLNNAQDHKRIFEKDLGQNTGGMGAYAPTPLYSKKLEKKIIESVIEPTLNAMLSENIPYTGFLYFGLMIVNGDPFVIEYNVRMGDPETQVVLPLMETDLLDLIEAIENKNLSQNIFKNKDEYCVTVVLSSGGYPNSYNKGLEIQGLETLKDDLVFHAGTSKNKDNNYITSGGRVLNVVGKGKTLQIAIDNAYKIIKKIKFKDMYYRKDIGKKGLNY